MPFEAQNKETLYAGIIRFAKQMNDRSASKMTKAHYLTLCESLGNEPDSRVMPLELDDFPDIVALSLAIYNNLRDSYIPGDMPHYIGKDILALPVLFDLYEITQKIDQQTILDIINIFDTAAVKASKARIDLAAKKAKQKPK